MWRWIALTAAGLFVLAIAWLAYSAASYYVVWSPQEEVVFDSGDVRLVGTLIKPATTGVFPAYVMLHGAGQETRSSPATRAHAKMLVRHGFAVLTYDKRGSGASGGDFAAASYDDFIADAGAAVRHLAGRSDIDPRRIGLFGASESGWFTPEIAAAHPEVAFVINKVGPPVSWIETVLWEVRNDYLADGAAESDLDRLVELTERRWAHIRAAAHDPALAEGPERQALEAAIAEARGSVVDGERLLPDGLPPYDPVAYQRFAARLSYDPTPFLEQSDVPMLYVFGALDINVPTESSVARLGALRRDHGKDITTLVLPDVGHPLYSWKGIFGGGYPPGYLAFVGSWAQQAAGQ